MDLSIRSINALAEPLKYVINRGGICVYKRSHLESGLLDESCHSRNWIHGPIAGRAPLISLLPFICNDRSIRQPMIINTSATERRLEIKFDIRHFDRIKNFSFHRDCLDLLITLTRLFEAVQNYRISRWALFVVEINFSLCD